MRAEDPCDPGRCTSSRRRLCAAPGAWAGKRCRPGGAVRRFPACELEADLPDRLACGISAEAVAPGVAVEGCRHPHAAPSALGAGRACPSLPQADASVRRAGMAGMPPRHPAGLTAGCTARQVRMVPYGRSSRAAGQGVPGGGSRAVPGPRRAPDVVWWQKRHAAAAFAGRTRGLCRRRHMS